MDAKDFIKKFKASVDEWNKNTCSRCYKKSITCYVKSKKDTKPLCYDCLPLTTKRIIDNFTKQVFDSFTEM